MYLLGYRTSKQINNKVTTNTYTPPLKCSALSDEIMKFTTTNYNIVIFNGGLLKNKSGNIGISLFINTSKNLKDFILKIYI